MVYPLCIPKIDSILYYQFSGEDLSKVIHYRKPQRRPEPKFQPAPYAEKLFELVANEEFKRAKTKEIVYNLARCGVFDKEGVDTVESQQVPPLAPFHANSTAHESAESKDVSQVAFCPILKANPTEPSTIYTILLRLKKSLNLMGQEHVPVCFDMGLLSKALEIVWANPQELKGVIPFDGGMHFFMCVMAAIGWLYGDAGLQALLSESGVFAAASANNIISGKDVDRGMYALQLVEEVLSAGFFMSFDAWCKKHDKEIPPTLSELLHDLSRAFSQNDYDSVLESTASISLLYEESLKPLINQFRQEGRVLSLIFQFWDQFLFDVMSPVKVFLLSTRSKMWMPNLAAKAALLPLLFATNRTTYSRYMPAVLLSMTRLLEEVERAFADGNFTAKLKTGKFNNVWIDYTLETTENKALKGSGGVIGLTLRGQALSRWFLARPITSRYAMIYHDEVCPSSQQDNVERKSVRKHWNDDIEKMSAVFSNSLIDPFDLTDPPSGLVNIATGAVPGSEVQNSLLNALETGKQMEWKFMQERLVPQEDDRKSFYAPLSRNNVKTMDGMKRSVIVRNKQINLDGEQMYMRLLAANALKKVPLERVMSFENAPVPLSIFNEDGTMFSTNKSHFLHKLESLSPRQPANLLPCCDAIIFDGNAKIHTLPPDAETTTFKSMALKFFKHVKSQSDNIVSRGHIKQIHVVFDR